MVPTPLSDIYLVIADGIAVDVFWEYEDAVEFSERYKIRHPEVQNVHIKQMTVG